MEPKTYGKEDILKGARAGLYLAGYIEGREAIEVPSKKFKLDLPDERSIINYFGNPGVLASGRMK